jgi:hypothetical protein
MRVVVTSWQREAERGIGYGVLRVAAVDLIAGVSSVRAQILAIAPAELADPAAPSKPGNANAIADGMSGRVPAGRFHSPNDFMTGDDGNHWLGKIAVDHVQVRSADATRENLDEHLPGAWRRLVDLDGLDAPEASPGQGHRKHCRSFETFRSGETIAKARRERGFMGTIVIDRGAAVVGLP